MRRCKRNKKGLSYVKRVNDINEIYDKYCRSGLSNREIWLRYVYPKYAITERTFYNILKAPTDSTYDQKSSQLSIFCNDEWSE